MNLITLLNNYYPTGLSEIASKKQMLEFATNYNNIFSREQEYGHFTASCMLLNSDSTKFLLLHHKKLNIWLQPGGHCDGCEDTLSVAIKEALEETSLESVVPVHESIFDLDIHQIPEFRGVPSHYHFDIRFLLKSNGDNQLQICDEVNDLKWVGFDEDLDEYKLNISVLRMLEKLR